MSSAILVHPKFDAVWPFAADYAHERMAAAGPVTFVRREPGDDRPASALLDSSTRTKLERLMILGGSVTEACVEQFPNLKEVALCHQTKETAELFKARNITVIKHLSEGYWGQSVAEFGLALTLSALRRIPQTHHEILTNLEPWNYDPPGGVGRSGARGQQYGDDSRFTNGTICGKRIRMVGLGNIGSRYAQWVSNMGADVSVWDPVAPEPTFHRSGVRREFHLDRLMKDAEILVPMMPLMDATRGIVKAEHLNALPKGCLVVLVTRAGIVDMPTLRKRVMNDELSLAADVFDVEPLPLNDPLLGRSNVVHTPHNAGRTVHANQEHINALLAQFQPR